MAFDNGPFMDIQPTSSIFVSTTGNNANAGTIGSPKRTIQAGLDAATPGTIVQVRAGTYNEQITYHVSGTSTAPIWLNSYDGQWQAAIVPVVTSTNTLQGAGVKNLVIQNMDVTAPTGAWSAIAFGLNESIGYMGGFNYNIVVQGCRCRSSTNGNGDIKINQTDGLWCVENTCLGGGFYNFDMVANFNVHIQRNDCGGATGDAAIFNKGGSTWVDVSYNKVHNFTKWGIIIGGWTGDLNFMRPNYRSYEGRYQYVHNNEILNVGQYAMASMGGIDSYVYNNYISSNPSFAMFFFQTSPLGPFVPNNIQIFNNTLNRNTNLTFADTGTGSSFTLTNNVVGSDTLTTGPGSVAINTTDFSKTLSQLTASLSDNTSGSILPIHIRQMMTTVSQATPITHSITPTATTVTTGTAVAVFHSPFAFKIGQVRIALATPSTSGPVEIDILVNGTTMFSVKPQINQGTTTNVGNVVPGTLLMTFIDDDVELSVSVTLAGTGAKGLSLTILPLR